MSVRHQVESGAPFHADRDLRMDIVIEAGGLKDATAPEYRDKSILLDVTYADPQAGVHMRAGSVDQNGSAASTSEAASATTTRVRDRCPSTNAATNSPPSRWKALGASVKKAAT
eukprot:jgi/Undpi1/1595/HiC_scaffold_11.g04985.m1